MTQAPIFHDQQLQAAATTGNGAAIDLAGISREGAIYIVWSAGTSAGAVTLETAHAAAYAGTWDALLTMAWSSASKVDIIQFSGCYKALRARISTDIVGGTLDVYA